MHENPYAPPSSALPSKELTLPERPKVVVAAVWMIAISFGTGFLQVLILDGFPETFGTALAMLLFLGFTYGIVHALYIGRNWMRWLSVILIAVGLALLPWSLSSSHSALDTTIYIVQTVLQGVAGILLVLPASQRWYRPNNSFKPKPLRGSA